MVKVREDTTDRATGDGEYHEQEVMSRTSFQGGNRSVIDAVVSPVATTERYPLDFSVLYQIVDLDGPNPIFNPNDTGTPLDKISIKLQSADCLVPADSPEIVTIQLDSGQQWN